MKLLNSNLDFHYNSRGVGGEGVLGGNHKTDHTVKTN